jgi:hypothetical protein
VDQLERSFGSAGEQASQLPAALLALANTSRVWLLLTLGSDRYAELQGDPALLELKRRGALFDLPAPGEAEITDAVKGPARAASLTFDAGERHNRTLPRALVDDTPSADALPLLQMTLSQLFEARAGLVLTWLAYEAMGGVPGAIASHADAVLARLSGAARSEVRPLVGALVRDVARGAQGQIRFTMTQADSAWESTPARRELVEQLVEARLLVRDEPEPGRKVLRAAHEAVLRQWNPARAALERIVGGRRCGGLVRSKLVSAYWRVCSWRWLFSGGGNGRPRSRHAIRRICGSWPHKRAEPQRQHPQTTSNLPAPWPWKAWNSHAKSTSRLNQTPLRLRGVP